MQGRAARNGFDWGKGTDVLEKLDEEVAEVRAAVAEGEGLSEEIGDLLFTVVNLGRHFSINAEDALRKANRKFEQRFSRVVEKLKERGLEPRDATLEEMERLWEEVKRES